MTLPPLLAAASALPYGRGGIDFEPFAAFESAERNADWIKSWTGNDGLQGREFRFFGQDGTGGQVGLWLTRQGKTLVEQPVVVFGSEGEIGFAARNCYEYLWILAGGRSPIQCARGDGEDFASGDEEEDEVDEADAAAVTTFVKLAKKWAPESEVSAQQVFALAHKEFPTFAADFRKNIKY